MNVIQISSRGTIFFTSIRILPSQKLLYAKTITEVTKKMMLYANGFLKSLKKK